MGCGDPSKAAAARWEPMPLTSPGDEGHAWMAELRWRWTWLVAWLQLRDAQGCCWLLCWAAALCLVLENCKELRGRLQR